MKDNPREKDQSSQLYSPEEVESRHHEKPRKNDIIAVARTVKSSDQTSLLPSEPLRQMSAPRLKKKGRGIE